MSNLDDPIRLAETKSILKNRYWRPTKPIVWWALGALGVIVVLAAILYDTGKRDQTAIAPALTTGSAVPQAPTNIPAGSGTQRR